MERSRCTVRNLQNDNTKIFDEDMEVRTSNNGHYAINILPDEARNFDTYTASLNFRRR